MGNFKNIRDFHHDSDECTGVLLCNLGSPDAPTPAALRRYLAQFLWDPRVIEISRPLWWLILHGIILRTRPKKSAHAYQSVWTDDGAPLIAISKRQTAALQQTLQSMVHGVVKVEMAMRYGEPSIAAGLARLQQANARRILVLPLYPQYSATTTASIFDAVVDELKTWRWQPELRFINHYHDDDGHIDVLATSIEEYFSSHGRPDKLLFSFHGMPRRYFDNGDPYFCECQKTARLVADHLKLDKAQWQLTFQSRFGREEWLQPYTDKTLEQFPQQGVKRVAVICPGFAADCLETLEEIKVENKNIFLGAGGEQFDYIPALNDRPDHIRALADLAVRHMQGWPEASAGKNSQSLERAQALGAKR